MVGKKEFPDFIASHQLPVKFWLQLPLTFRALYGGGAGGGRCSASCGMLLSYCSSVITSATLQSSEQDFRLETEADFFCRGLELTPT